MKQQWSGVKYVERFLIKPDQQPGENPAAADDDDGTRAAVLIYSTTQLLRTTPNLTAFRCSTAANGAIKREEPYHCLLLN